tara:strand:- start:3418 stop:4611 length:1194 start_codon:yes stop_codon:yes gene_type:complete
MKNEIIDLELREKYSNNADLSKVNLDHVKTPEFLITMLDEKDNVISDISEPQLIPMKEIHVSQDNPGRKHGVKMKWVERLMHLIEKNGWKVDGETCVVVKMESPEPGSRFKYSIYFTLHRYTASDKVQKKYDHDNSVLPCVVVTLKEGLTKEQRKRAINDMADFENVATSEDNEHQPYSDDDKDDNVLEYLNTFPKLKTYAQKLKQLKVVWKPKQVNRGMDPRTASAIIKRVHHKIGFVSPMIRYTNEVMRTNWTEERFASFNYCGEEIISLEFDNQAEQYPFGDERKFIVEFWHQPHFNRDIGNMLKKASEMVENGTNDVKILIVMDAHNAKGTTDVNRVRKDRIEEIENIMKHVSKEVRDLIHLVGFVPHLRGSDTEDNTTLISYKKLKAQFFGK